MKFSEILKAGFTITIQPDGVNNKGYIPTTFFYSEEKKGYIAISPAFIGGYHPHLTWSDTHINNHIENMIKDRFQIVITANEAHEKVNCLMKLLHHTERSTAE